MTDLHFDWDEQRRSIQRRFDEWIETEDGQAVYESVRRRAIDMRRRGWHHFGFRCLWEIARFDRSLNVGPNAGFKLNDHFHSRMARMLMDNEPELAGFFETRELKAA